MQGFIKLHRRIMNSGIWSDPSYLKLWLYCLMEASHTKREQIVDNQMVTLNSGEFVTGRVRLAFEMNKGMKPVQQKNALTWWRYLKNLEKWQMLNIKTNSKFSVVTIVNYGFYQGRQVEDEQQNEQQLNSTRTTAEQQLNTNKNVKNVKNVRITTTTKAENPIQFFESNIGPLSPIQMNEVWSYVEDFDGQQDVVIYAMQLALDRNKKNMGFVKYLCNTWLNNNAKTLQQVTAYEAETFNKAGESNDQTYKPRKGNAKATRKAEDSITGGQVGWIGRNQNS